MLASHRYTRWETIATFSRQERGFSAMSIPPTLTDPSVASKRPARMSAKVVLPAPEAPTSATVLPAGIVTVTSSSTAVRASEYVKPRRSTTMSARGTSTRSSPRDRDARASASSSSS